MISASVFVLTAPSSARNDMERPIHSFSDFVMGRPLRGSLKKRLYGIPLVTKWTRREERIEIEREIEIELSNVFHKRAKHRYQHIESKWIYLNQNTIKLIYI
jgi:hypothetical protein